MNAQSRLKTGKKVVRKKIVSGPALPGKLSDCISHDLAQSEVFLRLFSFSILLMTLSLSLLSSA
jgi:hypothetical protein